MTEQHKAVIEQFLDAWNRRYPEEFDRFVKQNVVRHCSATPAVVIGNLDQLKEFMRQDSAVFPDSVQAVTYAAAEGDLVGAWCTYEGTQQGPIGPLPASGRKVKFDWAAMFRMEDGKIAEWWVTWDNIAILRALGHLND